MRAAGEGFYTIGSTGHEGNVVLGRLVRASDPAFLHYRSGALMAERARQLPGATPIFDVLLSLVAAKDDPVSGGRHKVFGSVRGFVPPQTSTIASHLAKAVGCAFAIERGRHLGLTMPVPDDALVLCTFGDASANHNVAQGAFNAASWASYQGLPVPVLFVCEDNGIGISVRTPGGWIRTSFGNHPHLHYVAGDGLDLVSAFDAAVDAVAHVRATRSPAFLHLSTVRLLGHAGSDQLVLRKPSTSGRRNRHLEHSRIAQEATDPLLSSAALVMRAGLVTPDEVVALYEELRARVAAGSREAARRPKLVSAAEVAPLAPRSEERVLAEARRPADPERRRATFGSDAELPERSNPPAASRGPAQPRAPGSPDQVPGDDRLR